MKSQGGKNAVFDVENGGVVKNALSKSCRPFQNLHFDMQQGGIFPRDRTPLMPGLGIFRVVQEKMFSDFAQIKFESSLGII